MKNDSQQKREDETMGDIDWFTFLFAIAALIISILIAYLKPLPSSGKIGF